MKLPFITKLSLSILALSLIPLGYLFFSSNFYSKALEQKPLLVGDNFEFLYDDSFGNSEELLSDRVGVDVEPLVVEDQELSEVESSELDLQISSVPVVDSILSQGDDGISIHQLEDQFYQEKQYEFEESKISRSNSSLSAYSAPSNTNLNKTVMGFAPYWDLSAGNYVNYQFDKLSVVAYFALTCSDYGDWVIDSGYSGWNSSAMDDLIVRAHARGTKVVLVVKNFHNRSIQDLVSNKNGARDKLVDNIIVELARKNADGVNIDFEFVADSSYPVTDQLRANIVTFADVVADRVHAERPGSHVSIDVYGGSASWYDPYDVAALSQTSVDNIMVMSYDFYTTSAYEGKFGVPTSPTRGFQYWFTLEDSMNAMVAAADSGKILMGIPYYALEFPVQGDTYNSLVRSNCSTDGGVTYTKNCPGLVSSYTSVVSDSDYCNAGTKRYSSSDNVRWYSYDYTTVTTSSGYIIPSGKWQGYYDDDVTLAVKYDIVNQKNLGGVAIWALGYDNGRTELWNTLSLKFAKARNRELF